MKTLASEVLVISLPERIDRRKRIQTMLDDEQIPFRFVDGVRLRNEDIAVKEISQISWADYKVAAGWDSYLRASMGCKQAHIRCLEYAREKDLESVLVFEDDAAFHPGWFPIFQNAMAELPKGWLQLYLSAWHFRPATCVSPHLSRVNAAWQMTAVLYSRLGIEAALKCVQTARAEIDEWFGLHLHPFRCSYVVAPQVTSQVAGFSDCRGTLREENP